jgi:hypothetical protein
VGVTAGSTEVPVKVSDNNNNNNDDDDYNNNNNNNELSAVVALAPLT